MMSIQKHIDALANQVADMLEKGDRSAWTKPWSCTGNMPINLLTQKEYRGINTLILWLAAATKGYTTHHWCTFKQKQMLSEKYEVDITVRKGEKSTTCFRWVDWIPKQYKKKGSTYFHDGNAYREEEVRRWTMKSFGLFNLDQLENVPEELMPVTVNPMEYEYQQRALIAFQLAVPWATIHRGDRACYIPSKDEVWMPPPQSFFSEDDYASTLFHEYGHATGHKSRLDRLSLHNRASSDYAAEELVAEFTAAFLCARFDIMEPSARHADYLASWAKQIRNDPNCLMRAVQQAEKADQYLMDTYNAFIKENSNEQIC